MNAPNRYIVVLSLVSTLPMCSAKAWGPLAHYASSVFELRPAQNLPDLWLSRQSPSSPGGTLVVGQEVSEYFGWSHACHREGLVLVPVAYTISIVSWELVWLAGIAYPEEPTYTPEGIETPGGDMKEIITSKLASGKYSTDELALMKRTARGFAGHNAADHVVHFEYFDGGTIDKWIVEHQLKEQWAELVIFTQLGGYWEDGAPVAPYSLGATGHAGLINLAQKVFRKNRQTIDNQYNPRETIVVETSATIATRISSQNADLQDIYNANGKYQEVFWTTYQQTAASRGWPILGTDGVLAKYSDACSAAAMAISLIP